jgi:hypothetical protein
VVAVATGAAVVRIAAAEAAAAGKLV